MSQNGNIGFVIGNCEKKREWGFAASRFRKSKSPEDRGLFFRDTEVPKTGAQ